MNWEQELGLKVSALVGGLIGGLISLTYEEKLSFWRALILILSGGFTSGYAFALAETYMSLPHNLAGVFGFGIGLISMRIIDILIRLADAVRKNPSLLLSYSKLLKAFKNDGNSSTTPSGSSDVINNVDIAGEINPKDRLSN